MGLPTTTSLRCFIIVLCAISFTLAKDEKKEVKSVLSPKTHKEHVLINGINRPYQLSYYKKNKTDHILFFSYNVGLKNESTFEIGYSEGGSRVPEPVKEVKNGFATAINYKDDVIYLGGSEGIYVWNLTGKTSKNQVRLLVPKHDIWDLFYKNHLYFIAFPSRRLYKHHSGDESELQEHIHEKIFNFVIDGDGDTFINNKTGLYMIKKNSSHRIHIEGTNIFRAFEVNKAGVAHFCGQNEVYVADKENRKLHEVAKIKNIFGLTFDDDDHMIYSDPHQIVRRVIEKSEKKTDKEKKGSGKQ